MSEKLSASLASIRLRLPQVGKGRAEQTAEECLEKDLSSSRPTDQQQAVRELFRNRDFTLLWIGQSFSQIGDNCLLIAAMTLISTLFQSPLAMPDEVRGRVQSAVSLLVVTTTAMAEGLAALPGALIGVQIVFVAAGVVTALTGVAAISILRGAARLVSRGLAVGEV
jgi:hypothetical protein